VWNRPIEGLLITTVITLFIANLFDLSSISLMGSAGFLLIFTVVNLANVRLYKKTNSRRWISVAGAIACSSAFGVLIIERGLSSPWSIVILTVMIGSSFTIEILYKRITGRVIKPIFKKNKQ
jgi:hypothetical protein